MNPNIDPKEAQLMAQARWTDTVKIPDGKGGFVEQTIVCHSMTGTIALAKYRFLRQQKN